MAFQFYRNPDLHETYILVPSFTGDEMVLGTTLVEADPDAALSHQQRDHVEGVAGVAPPILLEDLDEMVLVKKSVMVACFDHLHAATIGLRYHRLPTSDAVDILTETLALYQQMTQEG